MVLGVPSSDALASVSERLDRFFIKHHKVIEGDGPYVGQLLAIGIPPQPKEKLKRALSSLPTLR